MCDRVRDILIHPPLVGYAAVLGCSHLCLSICQQVLQLCGGKLVGTSIGTRTRRLVRNTIVRGGREIAFLFYDSNDRHRLLCGQVLGFDVFVSLFAQHICRQHSSMQIEESALNVEFTGM